MAEVLAETFAVELHPFVPMRVACRFRHIFYPRRFPEQTDGAFAVVRNGRPTFAVHPNAVYAVIARQFFQLRNQQPVRVGSEDGSFVLVGFTVGVRRRPLRVQFERACVPYARIVHVERHAAHGRHVTPEA